jgi:hypothetical protein
VRTLLLLLLLLLLLPSCSASLTWLQCSAAVAASSLSIAHSCSVAQIVTDVSAPTCVRALLLLLLSCSANPNF